MNRKFVFSCTLILILVILILLFKNQSLLLSTLILFAAYLKHKLYPIKKELLWFLLVSLAGATIEILLINIGSAWTYLTPNILGLPIWMPLFWGVIGTTIIVMYEAFITHRN